MLKLHYPRLTMTCWYYQLPTETVTRATISKIYKVVQIRINSHSSTPYLKSCQCMLYYYHCWYYTIVIIHKMQYYMWYHSVYVSVSCAAIYIHIHSSTTTFSLNPSVWASRCLSDPARSTKFSKELRIFATLSRDSYTQYIYNKY